MKSRLLPLAAAAILAAPLGAHAKSITYDFSVDGGPAGPLAKVAASGSFTFDSSIIPAGGGLVTGTDLLSGLAFTWDGHAYDRSSATTGSLEFNSTGLLNGVNFGTSCDAIGACDVSSSRIDWDISGHTPVGSLSAVEFLYTVGNGQLYDSFQAHLTAAPEIDPATAASAMTLLLGALAVVRGRSRGRNPVALRTEG